MCVGGREKWFLGEADVCMGRRGDYRGWSRGFEGGLCIVFYSLKNVLFNLSFCLDLRGGEDKFYDFFLKNR